MGEMARIGEDAGSDFSWMFREEYPAVVRTAYLILGDRAAAEDVAQEAFIRLYARWAKISKYERPGAWVRRVAIRLAGRARRARRITFALSENHVAGQVVPPDPDLQRALLALPPSQRAAVVLHYLEGRPVAEVGSILGCATATAKVHLHRARKRLGALLGEETADVAG
jgi:RNA polymerase sigma-70 factor (sigma-E family)